MTIDERAAACLQHMDRVMMTRSQKPSEIIAHYLREAVEEAVAERDKLLAECREELFSLGQSSASAWEHGDSWERARVDRDVDAIHAKIDAMIGEQA